jgi:hypothetical protein
MISGIIGLIISIAVGVWIYQVVNKHGGKMPWLWAIGSFVLWPLVATIAGFKYDDFVMKVVGIIGLGLMSLGIALGIGLLALLQLPPR